MSLEQKPADGAHAMPTSDAHPDPRQTSDALPQTARQLSTRQQELLRELDAGEVWTPEKLSEFAASHGYDADRAGRLVYDIDEARAEYGPEVASRLKTDARDGTILWPQPVDSPRDPQTWSNGRKRTILAVAALAAVVPDFTSGLGISGLFSLAETFHTTPDVINNKTSNWSIFLLGPGGLVAVWLVRRFGRLPVLFWSQVIGFLFTIGCLSAQSLDSFAACRCLLAFFSSAPQVTGLYIVSDIYPAHRVDAAITIWSFAFICSPFISPWLGSYIVSVSDFRAVYGFGAAYVGVVVILIALFMRETMFDRYHRPIPLPQSTGLRYRVETLVGITGWRMRKFRTPIWQAVLDSFDCLWRPQALAIYVFVATAFGFGIGFNVTAPVFLAEPPRLYSSVIIGTLYLTPIIATLIGELVVQYGCHAFVQTQVKRNRGVFEAEMLLWQLYFFLPFVVGGLVLFGASFSNDLSVVATIAGWGMAEAGIVGTTATGYQYLNSSFPSRRGEVSALLNWARVLVGFAVPYFQTPTAESRGPVWLFGLEAGVVAATFVVIIPALQYFGPSLRNRFSIRQGVVNSVPASSSPVMKEKGLSEHV